MYKIFIFVSVFTCIRLNIFAQQLPDELLDIAASKYPQEKVYLQTDKSVYTGGETVWFKAYITADNMTQPLSKTLYAELLNDKGAVLQTKMMPIILSGASSDFILPDSAAASRFYIRAYTSWMLNFDSTLLYTKALQVIPKSTSSSKKVTAYTYTATFFPEGGDLILNIESKIAFKAAAQDGTPFNIKGNIVDSKNKAITAFAAVHDGMGYFTLTPLPGETYKAVWKDKAGQQHENNLPAAKQDGVALSVSIREGQLYYTLTRPDSANAVFTKFTVVAQIQQRMMYNAQINLSKRNTVSAPIATDSMPDGVMQVTVFNAALLPVAERLVFVNNNNYSFITDLHLTQKNMTKRGRNEIQIDAGGALFTNLSVSVTDADANPVSKNEENIYSALLLSCDLKGYIFNPAYYFSSDADSVKAHLDLVMMTNGWRRFKWKKLLANEWPALHYEPGKSIAVQGKVLGLTKAQLYNRPLTAILKTKNNQPEYYSIPIDQQGMFSLGSLYFFDTAKLYYQLSNDKDKTLSTSAYFNFDNNFIKAPAFNNDLKNSIPVPDRTDTSSFLKNRNLAALRKIELDAKKVQTLEEVKVVRKTVSLKQKLDKEYTSGFFSGDDGYTFTTEDDPFSQSSPSVLAYLQGKVPGLQINTNGGGSAIWRGTNTSFFLNEMQADVNLIQTVNMTDVALIKIFRPPFFGASTGGAGGAIAVYTKKGAGTNPAATGLPSTNIYGYSVIRQFYSPDYETDADQGSKDYRTTLYWNPNVHFDKKIRRVVLPFFNSDNCKKIRVTVEGIDENGVLTREEKIFE
ncbi:MAG: hypothetical protein QM791_09200 [Ferruginibacter sp.]